ncbi:MAG: DNA-protecting protein DprA [Armatimonadetes bacterium]|nr:DNA-protecting protein DprA [Armatimonadota bacterium]
MQNNERKKIFYLTLHLEGVNFKHFRKLLDYFNLKEIDNFPFIDYKEKIKRILNLSLDEDKAKFEIEKACKLGVTILTLEDLDYPSLLKKICQPPLVLYIKGEIPQGEKNISIVGARKATNYGLMTAEWLGEKLAEIGITIISGMARGIDSSAHIGALKVKGKTLAVLGCGIDIIYPPENKKLKREIEENGAVISEFPLKTPPHAYNFPLRNRIISGMSWGTIVVEAGEHSGSLITANSALEEGREVFAVPGNIKNSQSKGTHKLIKEGAKLIENIEDILEELPFKINKPEEKKEKIIDLSKEKKLLYELIDYEGKNSEELILSSNLSSQTVLSSLLLLETKGLIKRQAGNFYLRIN